jgi:hypothetical protein
VEFAWPLGDLAGQKNVVSSDERVDTDPASAKPIGMNAR